MNYWVAKLAGALLMVSGLQACSLVTDAGAQRVYLELHAPDSFRATGEPFQISEWDPWSIVREQGCLFPGDRVALMVLQKGPSLMVSIPGASFTLVPRPGAEPSLVGAEEVVVTGSGALSDPFVVRFSSLNRWRAFLAQYDGVRSAEKLTSYQAVAQRLDADGSLRADYFAYLDRFNKANGLSVVCPAASP